nr:class I SAM-dependent methyltransferase [Saprospiraceae bacterium]
MSLNKGTTMGDRKKEYYRDSWEAYYQSVGGDIGEVPWDVVPELAAEKDRFRMVKYFRPNLPLVDVGCGTGTQTRFLSETFERVIGTDVSAGAIEMASNRYGPSGPEFRQMDILNEGQVSELHEELGDCNLYMRGTLQQILKSDRGNFSRSVKRLLGENGHLYFIELSPDARSFFLGLHRELGGLPAQLKRVLAEKVTKMVGVGLEEVTNIFDSSDFIIHEKGRDSIALKISATDRVNVPAVYGIISGQ